MTQTASFKIIGFFLVFYQVIIPSLAQKFQVFQHSNYPINSLSFSSNSQRLVVGGGEVKAKKGEIVIINLENMTFQRRIKVEDSYIAEIALSPASYTVFSVGNPHYSSNTRLWSVPTGQKIRDFTHNEPVDRILEATLGKRFMKLKHSANNQEALSCLAIDSYGLHLATGGLNKTLRKWQVNSGKLMHTFKGHNYFIVDICISPNGKYMASAGGDFNLNLGEIKLWDWQTNAELFSWKFMRAVTAIKFSPDNQTLAVAYQDGTTQLYDLNSLSTIPKLKLRDTNKRESGAITSLDFSPNSHYLVTGGKDKKVKIWDLRTQTLQRTWDAHTETVTSVAFSPDGRWIASGGNDRQVILWQFHSFRQQVEEYVAKQMEIWIQKGKFEKTEDYVQRVAEPNRLKAIQEFAHDYIQQLAQKHISWVVATNEYDADNESFKIQFQNISPIIVKVPLAEAQSFDQNFAHLLFLKPIFALNKSEELVLSHLEIYNPKNNKQYSYDMQQTAIFQPQDFKINHPTINFEVLTTTTKPQNTQANPNTENEPAIANEITQQLPRSRTTNPDAVAVVIGNSQYLKTKPVKYALQDAQLMKRYLIEVLGFKENNILYVENATYSDFKLIFGEKGNHEGKLFAMVKPQKSDVFVFYSGHGAPGLKKQQAYFVPVECEPQYVELTGYLTDIFYENLALLPAKSVTVAIDACFSGIDIFENISPIVIRSKGMSGIKNGILIASSRAEQVSCWYNEKGQGMFTYFFLKAIHNKNADSNKDNKLTFEEIFKYISDESEGIPYYARRLRGVVQNPIIVGEETNRIWIEFE